MQTMYAVVYGGEWEDIVYFTDIEQALTRLVTQCIRDADRSFPPIMYVYDNVDGQMRRRERAYVASRPCLAASGITRVEDVSADPRAAFAAVIEADC